MPDNLVLDFPVLKNDGGDFSSAVSYTVEAQRTGKNLEITHTLEGQSFIRRLLEKGAAKFSVLLLYRDSAERHNFPCDGGVFEDNQATAKRTIPIEFSYAPEIMPCIVVLHDEHIVVDAASGLTDFWAPGEDFNIPAHSRIALAPRLKFTSGDVAHLMQVIHDETLNSGEMKVDVRESAGEGEASVSLYCEKGVFDELHKITTAPPRDASESMRSAIITQALTATYAYMQSLGSEYDASGVLLAHLEEMNARGIDWRDEDFNPSLAATKMHPYAVTVLNGEHDDDD